MPIKRFAQSDLSHWRNELASPVNSYLESMRDVFSLDRSQEAFAEISAWPGYRPTPLHNLGDLASKCSVGELFYKDESFRFGLKSFKALGGSYAVARHLLSAIEVTTGERPGMDALFKQKYSGIVSKLTVATATDGNHGRSVAWGAQLFGCACEIFIHADVSAIRAGAMADLGARVTRISGNYDESVREVAKGAAENNWIIVSDNSYAGYLDIPKDVTAGYSVMLKEIVEQLGDNVPTHVFVQGGCGGLAAAVCGYFWEYWGKKRPRLIIVEPEQANCLQQSAATGRLTVVDGKLETRMAGLACGEVSLLAWELLETGADDFLTLPEDRVPVSMRALARGLGGDPSVEAGESAVAGVGALMALSGDSEARDALGITVASSVLVFGTEGATDGELYEQLINAG